MIETRRLKNVLIFIQTILSFLLSRKIKIKVVIQYPNSDKKHFFNGLVGFQLRKKYNKTC